MLEELDIGHHADGFQEFFSRVGKLETFHKLPVVVAMEGCYGYARPLDGQICRYGYKALSTGMFKSNNINREHSLI